MDTHAPPRQSHASPTIPKAHVATEAISSGIDHLRDASSGREMSQERIPDPLDLVIQATGVCYFDWIDVTQRDMHTSPGLRELLRGATGRKSETWDDLLSVVHPEDQARLDRALLRTLAQRTRLREDVRFRSDGDYVPVEITAVATGGDAERPVRVTGAIRRREIDRDWQRSKRAVQERLELVVQATKVGVYDWLDMSTEEVVFSDELKALLGYDNEHFEMTLDHFWSLIHEDDVAGIREAIAVCIETGAPFETKYRIQFANKGYRWVRSMGKVSMNATGKQRLTGAIFDIDEQVTLQRRTERRSEQRGLAVKASNSGVWDWRDVQRDEVFLSEGLVNLAGYHPGEIKSTVQGFWEIIYEGDRPATEEALTASLQEGRPFRVEYRLLHKDGSLLWVRSSGVPVKDEDGKVVRLTGSITDIRKEVMIRDSLRAQAALYKSGFAELSDKLVRAMEDIKNYCDLAPAGEANVLSPAEQANVLKDIAKHAHESLALLRDAQDKMR